MAEIRTFEDLLVWQKEHGLFLEAARDREQSSSRFNALCAVQSFEFRVQR